MAESSELLDYTGNPLDLVEDVLTHQDWIFDRPNPQQLCVTVSGRHGAYSLNFFWQEDFNAMQFLCAIDMSVPEPRRDMAARALMILNARMPIGHFTLQDGVPCYRYTSLFRNNTQTASDHIEEMVEIAIGECDRTYGAFDILAGAEAWNGLLDLALAETAGEA